jgi:surface protein
MSNMFENCTGLESLNLSGWDISNIANVGVIFSGCTSLTTLDVSGWTIGSASIWNLFMGCTGITTLDLSTWNTAGVTNMYCMFVDCANLATIYVGEGWTTENVTNSDRMFGGCTSLVGGMGTVYDPDHVDAEYAHIDGGSENPGYFTEKPTFVPGDANGDGKVDVQDITAIINYILGNNPSPFNVEAADVNHTSDVNVMDVTAVINIILGIE